MSKNDSRIRAAIYVAIAMLTYASGDIEKMREADAYAWAKFIMGDLIAGAIVLRAFIDKTVTEIADNVKSVTATIASKTTPALIIGGLLTLFFL